MAGGVDLLAALKAGQRIPHLVLLDRAHDLAALRAQDDALRIGATATHWSLIHDPAVIAGCPDLVAGWRRLANPRIQLQGTVGGNLMSGVGTYDGLPLLLAARAEAVFHGAPASPLATDIARTPGLLTALRVPAPATLRLVTDRSLKPAIAAAIGTRWDDGRCTAADAVVWSAYALAHVVPIPARGLDARQLRRAAPELALGAADSFPPPLDDAVASRTHRAHLLRVLLGRLLRQAVPGGGVG